MNTTFSIPSDMTSTLISERVLLSKGLVYYLREYWDEEGDPRTRNFPLMSNGPWTMFVIMLAYLYFVKRLGPQFMKNREPFILRKIMLFYNISLVLFNAYFFVEALVCIQFGLDLFNFKFPDRYDMSPKSERLIYSGYAYFLTKFLDLFDTVFFILRKKYSQVTLLHLYHHTVVPVLGWLALRFSPTAAPIGLFPIVNSLIHVIMYTYYALSSFGPQIQKYLWWKKYITILQMYQFVLYGVYYCFFVFLQTGYPSLLTVLGFVQPIIFFNLFYRFYRQSYYNKSK